MTMANGNGSGIEYAPPRPAAGYARSLGIGDARRAAVAGCGRTGAEIALALAERGCEVVALDIDPAALERFADRAAAHPRIRLLIADVTLESDLRAAGAQDADAFIAVAGADAANALAAQIAQHMLRIPVVICKIDDPAKREMYESMEIRTVSRVSMLAEQAVRRMEDG